MKATRRGTRQRRLLRNGETASAAWEGGAMEPEPVSAREMNDKRRRTTESAAEGTRSNKGAAVKAAEATRREKTETVSVC